MRLSLIALLVALAGCSGSTPAGSTSSSSSTGTHTTGGSGTTSSGSTTGSNGSSGSSSGSTGGGCCLTLNCESNGLICDSGHCQCYAPLTTGTSGSTGSTSGSSGTTGSCTCDGCTNLGLGCDQAQACQCIAPATTSSTSGGSTGGTNLCTSQRCVVYAETNHELYQVDPSNPSNLQDLCAFTGDLSSTNADAVNDIAVEGNGTLYAITRTDLYSVDPATCSATHITQVAQSGTTGFNCLAFTSAGILVAATQQGDVSVIDQHTGAVSSAGSFGNNLGCSGDIVSVNNGTTDLLFATAKTIGGSATASDKLVSLNPTTYHATVIGSIGFPSVFGLGFWGGVLYGFDKNGNTIEIDVGTGQGAIVNTTNPKLTFYGAGTTPLAPIINR